MCVFQAFRDEIAPLKQDVRAVNDLAGQLTPLDVQLSSTSNRQLDNLNMRWKLLQVFFPVFPIFFFSVVFPFPFYFHLLPLPLPVPFMQVLCVFLFFLIYFF